MATRKRFLSLKVATVFLAAVGVAVFAVNELTVRWTSDGRWALPAVECERLASNFKIQTVAELPEQIASLICDNDGPNSHHLFVGTRGKAGVYRCSPRSPFGVMPLIPATGDDPGFGTAQVSVLALTDAPRDQQELIALTAQETPRGKPRAYVFKMPMMTPVMTAADIASSWPHGIAFVKDVFGRPTFLSAFCGFGEIVEFRTFDRKTAAGFRSNGLECRQLGSVSGSGEQISAVELLGSNPYVLVARGYKFNGAAIEVYGRDHTTPFNKAKPGALGLGWARRWELREGDKFGNVRFLVGALRNGVRDLYAWWCVGLADGDTEFVHYRIGLTGIVERKSIALGPAADYWPQENWSTLVDADGDGVEELYFMSRTGNLWRLDLPPADSSDESSAALPEPSLMGFFPAGGGPIVPCTNDENGVIPLYIAVSNYIVKATPKKAPRQRPIVQVKLAEPSSAAHR